MIAAHAAIEEGRLQDAIVILRRVTSAESGNADPLMVRAHVARELGLLDEAAFSLDMARRLCPDSIEIVHNLGAFYEAAGESFKARSCYEDAITRRPDFFPSYLNLGNVRRTLGDLAGAQRAYEQALHLKPDSAKAHGNLANLLKLQGVLTRAEEHFRRASELDPADSRWWFGVAATMHDLGRLDEAMVLYNKILERAPGDEKAKLNLAYALLGSGDFARGWPGTEIRFELSEGAVKRHACPAPRWSGESITDGALLVWGEQGVADEILFAGMYPELQHRAENVILECRAKLQPLFARSFPWALVVPKREPADDRCIVDVRYQSPAASLGTVLRPNLDSFPSRSQYLFADSLRVERWRARLAALGQGLKVGFCWRSSKKPGERSLSCSSIEHWEALFRLPGVHWICLQYDDCEPELELARARFAVELHRFDDVNFFDDLDEVAALNASLDLVISRRCAVSVLSAALGVQTWEFGFGSDWQTHGTGAHPWLPALVRFERAWNCGWEAIFARLADCLSRRLAQ
jgi:Flp pilus assembly protein TadD